MWHIFCFDWIDIVPAGSGEGFWGNQQCIIYMRCTVFRVARCAGRLRLCWVRVISTLLKNIAFSAICSKIVIMKYNKHTTSRIKYVENNRSIVPALVICLDHCTKFGFSDTSGSSLVEQVWSWLKRNGNPKDAKGMGVQTASFPLSHHVYRWNDAYSLWCAWPSVPR